MDENKIINDDCTYDKRQEYSKNSNFSLLDILSIVKDDPFVVFYLISEDEDNPRKALVPFLTNVKRHEKMHQTTTSPSIPFNYVAPALPELLNHIGNDFIVLEVFSMPNNDDINRILMFKDVPHFLAIIAKYIRE